MNVVKEEAQVQRCSSCKSASELWLYDVRHRGIYRQLCAACLLRLHSSFFCPVCLEVYADGLPPENNIKCGNCPSTVHVACAPELVPSYVCLCCANGFSFLAPLSSLSKNMQREEEKRAVIIDAPAAKIILAAAQVAAISMTRAAASAWSEADKKVRDSAIARKKARDSLLHASQRVENQTAFAVVNQKKNTEKKTCSTKAEEMEKPSRGMPNASSAKKRMVDSEDDDKLKAFTSSLLLQHRNIRNKATSETGKPKLAEDSISSVKTLQCHLADALNKDEQDRLIPLKCEEGSSNSSSVLN